MQNGTEVYSTITCRFHYMEVGTNKAKKILLHKNHRLYMSNIKKETKPISYGKMDFQFTKKNISE